MINIVLFQPEIPYNTGNIGRTCLLTGSKLHLIRPLGFILTDKHIKKAGMDYWKDVDVTIYEDFEDFMRKNPGARIYAVTTKGDKYYHEVEFMDGDFLLFGRESSGLPKEIMELLKERQIRVPMIDTTERSLNLCNTVAIVLYEALKSMDFKGTK